MIVKTGKELIIENGVKELNKNYAPKNDLYISDEHDNAVKVDALVLKEDAMYKVYTDKGEIECGSKHTFVMADGTFKHAKDLIPTDKIKHIAGEAEVTSILNLGRIDNVLDLEVESPTHLYSDASGLVHHNSYGIDKKLTELYGPEGGGKNDKWAIFKGKVSLIAVYETLFRHNGKVIVFDDADSVFASLDAANLLKAALDTKKHRYVSYMSKSAEIFDAENPKYYWEDDGVVLASSLAKSVGIATTLYLRSEGLKKSDLDSDMQSMILNTLENQTIEDRINFSIDQGKLPNKFEFTGSCIFISNKKLDEIDSAVRDRSIAPIEIDMTLSEIIDRIEHILPHIKAGDDGDDIVELDLAGKQEVLDYFRKTMLKYGRTNLSLRVFKQAMKYRLMDPVKWKDYIKFYSGV